MAFFASIPRIHNQYEILLTTSQGKPVNCYYCPNCISHLYHHQTVLGDKIVVRTVFLEGNKKFPVVAELYGKDKLDWQPEIAKGHVFAGAPE